MTSRELLYVQTVADEKNISKAAKKLFMAQPSLSQSIQRIEEAVGTPLFIRSSSGLSLTFAGERYYRMASQILKIYEDFELEISDINNLKTGRIHLGTTNHLGTLVLPKVLPEFSKICPHVEVIVTEENSSSLEHLLLSGELDFAVIHASQNNLHPQLRYEEMTKDPFVVVLSPEHRLVKEAVKTDGYPYPVLDIRLLKDEDFLMLHPPQRIRQITDSILAQAGIIHPHIKLMLRNYETAQLLAAKGLGVTLLPSQYCQIPSPEYPGTLLGIDKHYDSSWNLCIAYPQNGFLSKADRLFIQMIKQAFPS